MNWCNISIQVDLTGDQAWAFAEFLKRVSYGDYRLLAVSDDEARDMIEAGELVRKMLAEQGVAPR